MCRRIGIGVVVVGVVLLFLLGTVCAEDAAPGLTNEQTKAIIDLLEDKGIITGDEAANFMDRINGKPELQESMIQAEDETPVANQAQPEPATKEEVEALRENIRRSNDAMMLDQRLMSRRLDDMEANTLDPLVDNSIKSSWAQRITLSGDVRLRYQADRFVESNDILFRPDDFETVINTTEDRDRFRYRARLGLKAKLLDYREANVGKVEAGFRMTTGNEDDPVSTNDTMGDYFTRDSFVLDRAYLKYKFSPINPVWDRMPQFSLVGGRFANPWFSSDLVWDSDLNFEGVAAKYETDTEQMQPFNIFLTAGIFPLQEEEFSSRDKWLWGGQVGFEYRPRYDMMVTLAAAYYDYQNIEGVRNTDTTGLYDFTAPMYQQKGNTLMDIDPSDSILAALATGYDILDVYLNANIGIFFPIQIILEAQYVKNFGFDRERVATVNEDSDPVEDTEAYMVGATIGYPKIVNFAEWNVGLKYKYLGADAVLDAFTDSDFHLGGTNAKGWILKGEYGLYRNVWLTARWLSSDEIKSYRIGVDTMQLDINARF